MKKTLARFTKHAFVKALYLVALMPLWLIGDCIINTQTRDIIDHPWIALLLFGCSMFLTIAGRALEMEMEKYDPNY